MSQEGAFAMVNQLIPADNIPVLTSPEEGALAVREALERWWKDNL